MKTVQAQRSVEMENVVNHTWAEPLVSMSQASILEVIITPECCLFVTYYFLLRTSNNAFTQLQN